ncbi:MAG: ABC transporter ATP-binding protein [Chloroflexaceae bacterium]
MAMITLIPPLLIRDLIDHALPGGDLRRLNWLAGGMIAVPVLNGVFNVWQQYLSARISQGIMYDLRRALYRHIQQMSLRFFTQTRSGELMSRLNNDVLGAQRAVSGTLFLLFSNLVSLLMILTIMLALEWRLTLLGLAILPLFIWPARRVACVLRTLRRRSLETEADMNAALSETLNVNGSLLAKLFGQERHGLARFSNAAADVRDIGTRSAVVGQWLFMILSLISAAGSAVVFWMGGYLVLHGEFTIGTIVAFSTYLGLLYTPLMALTNAPVQFAQSLVSFERVFEILDIPIEIGEQPNSRPLIHPQGHIQFEQVYFAYDAVPHRADPQVTARTTRSVDDSNLPLLQDLQRDATPPISEHLSGSGESLAQWALCDVNVVIEPGQIVALVGPSGAGKTTLSYLIPRLYDPTKGRVLIDGRNVRQLTLQSLAQHIGMVTQETYLFYDTIRANLLYARPNATESEVIEAAKVANIHDFITRLPDGYDTIVGERGYRLSGGERQRIALARIILKDPCMVILDEATSHLDSLSEMLIQEALQRVLRGRTSLVIAHRLSTILSADVIFVMEHGRVVEHGTHTELLARNGLYTTLYKTQFGGEQVVQAVPVSTVGEPSYLV